MRSLFSFHRLVQRMHPMPAHPAIASLAKMIPSHDDTTFSTQHSIVATVEQVTDETPSVKHLVLRVNPNNPISFKPGQWLDCYLPGVKQVGGYSICSTPAQLEQQGTFELAVKRSSHPPAQWIHTHAKPGSQVGVQVGGNFVLHPSSLSGAPSLFVAGGIGITALASMVGHLVERSSTASGPCGMQLPAVLLYSAQAPDEFALLRKLTQWQAQSRGMLDIRLFVTGHSGGEEQQSGGGAQHADGSSGSNVSATHTEHRRIGLDDLQAALQKLQIFEALSAQCSPEQPMQHVPPQPQVYVCGPPSLTDAMLLHLERLGCQHSNVHSERWW